MIAARAQGYHHRLMRALVHILARLLALVLVLVATGSVPVLAAALETDHVEDAEETEGGCSDCSPTCECACCPVRLAEHLSDLAPVAGAEPPELSFAQPRLRLPEGVRSDVFHPPSA